MVSPLPDSQSRLLNQQRRRHSHETTRTQHHSHRVPVSPRGRNGLRHTFHDLLTPATSDVQPFNVWHITYDSYFRLYQTAEEGQPPTQSTGFSTDVGLTVGVLPFEK